MDLTKNSQEYYGKVLNQSSDLQTNACSTMNAYPPHIKSILAEIHPQVIERYYGCGLIIPEALENTKVLDLGSGAGRDCYILSKLIGPKGHIIGVDITEQQIQIAQKHIDFHTKKFNYQQPNISFLNGDIDNLENVPLEKESFDIVVSNCVVNLLKDKEKLLKNVHSLLKEGGEMYFSDVYSEKRVPKHLLSDPVLHGECLSGALYWNDFHDLAKKTGFKDPRIVSISPITIENSEVSAKLGDNQFYSVTYRLFKLKDLEHACEDYGQAVIYKGTILNNEHSFILDRYHFIPKGNVFKTCGNTYNMLHQTRFKEHFDFIGDFSIHYGIFEGCGEIALTSNDNQPENTSCC